MNHSSDLKYHYTLFGLYFATNVPISGVKPLPVSHSKRHSLSVTMGDFPKDIKQIIQHSTAEHYYVEPGDNPTDPPHLTVNLINEGSYFHLHYASGVEFILNKTTTHVWGSWRPPFTLHDASLFLLGPILGFILRLQGITPLHASCININGIGLAITGPSGNGKSTLAGAFAAAGYPVVTDDILPLKLIEKNVYGLPGNGRIRLYPNSFKNIAGLPDDLPALTANWEKCYLDLSTPPYTFHDKQIPIQAIYILDWGDKTCTVPSLRPVQPASAVPLLASNTYRNELLNNAMRREEFQFLCRLVTLIPVKTILMTDSLNEISSLRHLILNDFSG